MKISKFIIIIMLILLPMSLFSNGNKELETLKVINISYVKSPFNLQIMVIKEMELLEKEFKSDGIEIIWHEISSGAKQAEAMAAGSLDIASVMNTASVIIANSAGNDVDIIDIVSRPINTFTIMTAENGISNIKDLSGKTVAGPKGTVLHQLLEAVITKEDLKDVSLVSMGLPQAQIALLSGNIDAALLAGTLVLKTKDAGGKVLTTSEGYVKPLLVSVSPKSFIEKNPIIIERYKKVQQEAYNYIMNNKIEAISIGSSQQEISYDYAVNLYESSGIANLFTESDIEGLIKDIKFLKDLKMIEHDVTTKDIVNKNLNIE